MGGKRKRSHGRVPAAAIEAELVDLLANAHEAVERALDTVTGEPVPVGFALPDGMERGEPCGPAFRRTGAWAPVVDPMLIDRYHGLLVRSGMVAGSVHHLPSRLRERTETSLRELIVGVARDRPASGARVDALVLELFELMGERIAVRVEEWRDPVG